MKEKDFLVALTDLVRPVKEFSQSGTAVIAIVGGAASGKTTLAKALANSLGSADTLSTDDYVVKDRAYRRAHLEGGDPLKKYAPDKLNQHIASIKGLKAGESFAVPTYNESTGEAVDAAAYSRVIEKVEFLIVEGDFNLVENPDLLIYFDVPDDVRLKNRIARDLVTRNGKDEDAIKENFNLRQKMQHIPHTLPTKGIADVVVQVNLDDSGNYLYKII